MITLDLYREDNSSNNYEELKKLKTKKVVKA